MSLNVAKAQSMLVSTKIKRKALDKSSQHLQVKINGTELEVVSKIKYLGVLLDNSLDWKAVFQMSSHIRQLLLRPPTWMKMMSSAPISMELLML